MFAKLTGMLDLSQHLTGDGVAIIDVQGVGYMVHCSSRTFRQFPASGQQVTLWIETHVREDRIQLFGFYDTNEQYWFRLLLTVQGVGVRSALSLLGSLSPVELHHAIMFQDKAALTRADGVGPKLALRLMTELKDKSLPVDGLDSARVTSEPIILSHGVMQDEKNVTQDAIAALVHLGFNKQEVSTIVWRLVHQYPEWDVEILIRRSLQELSH